MNTIQFTYTDPREFDGSPYDAAYAAGEQLIKLLKLAKSAAADVFVLARVAELQRQQDSGKEPNAGNFEDGLVGTKLNDIERELGQFAAQANAITMNIGYDPLHPPKEE